LCGRIAKTFAFPVVFPARYYLKAIAMPKILQSKKLLKKYRLIINSLSFKDIFLFILLFSVNYLLARILEHSFPPKITTIILQLDNYFSKWRISEFSSCFQAIHTNIF